MIALPAAWKGQIMLAAGAAALAAAFGAGWQVNGWRLDALRAAEAEARAEAMEMRDKAARAAEARLTALRGDYTRLQERLNEIPDTGDCGLDAGRVFILDGLR